MWGVTGCGELKPTNMDIIIKIIIATIAFAGCYDVWAEYRVILGITFTIDCTKAQFFTWLLGRYHFVFYIYNNATIIALSNKPKWRNW